MLGSIALLIVVGVLLEGLPSLNVLAPLLIPIAGKLGISELHYALVLIIAMGIGGFMPLAGVGFYVCCAIMRCDMERASRAMLPYLIMVLIGLLIVAFVPWFALFCQIFRISRMRHKTGGDHASQEISQRRRCGPGFGHTFRVDHGCSAHVEICAFRREDHPANIAAKQFASRVERAPRARSRSTFSQTTFWEGRPSRRNRSSSAPSIWACPPRVSSTNTIPPSPP